jgi:transposase-like protein
LVTAVATSYLLGVSTRRMERLVAALGTTDSLVERRRNC